MILEYTSSLLRKTTGNNDVITELGKYIELLEEKLALEGDPKDKLKQLQIELIVRSSDVTAARKQWEDVMLRHQDDVGVYDKQIICIDLCL